MPEYKMKSEYKLDMKDKQILVMLQNNSRESLTNIARHIRLSVDSVHKRIKKMVKNYVFIPSIFVNPKAIGYPLVSDIRMHLHNTNEKRMKELITYLVNNPKVNNLMTLAGDWDMACVLISRDADDLNQTSREIRNKFADIIHDWRSTIILEVHKLERYDMTKL